MPDETDPTPTPTDDHATSHETAGSVRHAGVVSDARDAWPYREPADPGTRLSRRVALLLAVVATLVVAGLQNLPGTRDLISKTPAPPPATEREVAPPSDAEPAAMLGKLYIKLADFIRADPNAMPQLESFTATDADRVRNAVVAAELLGAEAAVERLDTLADTLEPGDPLAEDAADLRDLYASGLTGDDLPSETRARLEDHHGYFARAALTFALDDDDPAREALRSGGLAVMLIMLGFGGITAVALVAGFGLFIAGVVLVAQGKIRARMPRPDPGGSVFLEAFALFVAGFLVLDLVMMGVESLAGPDAVWTGYARLGSQWLLLLTPFWPLVRGMRGDRFRAAIGLHTGRGLFKEIGLGVLGYLAGLPVFLFGAVLSLTLMMLAQAIRVWMGYGEPPAPSNPVIELVGAADPVALAMVFLLATVWAPLCEELIFRGALLRHLSARLATLGAVVLTATVFGFMHGYGPLLVFPLIALGSVFGVLRAWRGSLVAPITAHALHNATVLTLAVSVLRLLGG